MGENGRTGDGGDLGDGGNGEGEREGRRDLAGMRGGGAGKI